MGNIAENEEADGVGGWVGYLGFHYKGIKTEKYINISLTLRRSVGLWRPV